MTERLRPGYEIQRMNIVHLRREILKTTSGDYKRDWAILSTKAARSARSILTYVVIFFGGNSPSSARVWHEVFE